MTPLSIVLLVGGVIALVLGAEALIRGATRIAARTGLSTVVIGLTVVAFGTSAPELAVSVGDVVRGGDEAGGIALGNVVGSNIANVLLALGISAAVGGSLVVARRIIRIDVPIMIGASVLVLLMSLNGEIDRLEGFSLVTLLVVYVTWTVVSARQGNNDIRLDLNDDPSNEALAEAPVWKDLGFIAAGLALLVGGSQALVSAATDIAAELGVSDLVIGLTVVAIGTSLPEVATSVLAALRGERDLAVGNAVGSNLFNLLAVLGVTASVSPNVIPVAHGAIQVDIPVMIAVAVTCVPIFANGHVLARWEGALFFLFYIGYITWLILDAADHSVRTDYGNAMLYFVIPITALTLTMIGVHSQRKELSAR